MLRNYKELKVWEKSYQLCLEIYQITKEFPKNEIYGLISQMRRAALSIPSNIAEGYGRKTTSEYLRPLYIDNLVKTQKNVTPAPIFIGINSSRSPDDVPAKAGNHLKTLDSRFHGNDDKGPNWTFYETTIYCLRLGL